MALSWDFRPAHEALRARLEADLAGVIRHVTRKNLPARAFPPDQQPAIVLVENGGGPAEDGGHPGGYRLDGYLVLHSQIGADDEAPGDSLLELIARIEKALQWRPGESRSDDGYWTTLGGAVRWARLGPWNLEDDPGRDTQISTVFEVSMLVTPRAE